MWRLILTVVLMLTGCPMRTDPGIGRTAPNASGIRVRPPRPPNSPLRAGTDIPAPWKIHNVKAVPPAGAKDISGTVIIDLIITFDGTVRAGRVVRGVPMLNQAAVDAVKQWRYTPSTQRGKAVEVAMMVTVTFGQPVVAPPDHRRT